MKKGIALVLCALMILSLAGCSTSRGYTFNVSTGDQIKVMLDTTDGYSITSDVPFTVSNGDEIVMYGDFLTLEGYAMYAEAAKADENCLVMMEGTDHNGNEYLYWTYQYEQFNYIVKVADSNSALLLSNTISGESARECYDRLTIIKED